MRVSLLLIIYILLVIAWWKQGLMPWWYAILLPIFLVAFGSDTLAYRTMGIFFATAGFGHVVFARRMVNVVSKRFASTGRPISPGNRFLLTGRSGLIVLRVTGVIALLIGVGMMRTQTTVINVRPPSVWKR